MRHGGSAAIVFAFVAQAHSAQPARPSNLDSATLGKSGNLAALRGPGYREGCILQSRSGAALPAGRHIVRNGPSCRTFGGRRHASAGQQMRLLAQAQGVESFSLKRSLRQSSAVLVSVILSLFVALSPPTLSSADAAHAPAYPAELGRSASMPADYWRYATDVDGKFGRYAMQIEGALAKLTGPDASSEEERANAEKVVNEVWELMDTRHLDARGDGFQRERWASLRDDALAQLKGGGLKRARGIVGSMVASGVQDTYTKFISPEEMQGYFVKNFDITGVGLTIGTERDFQERTTDDSVVMSGPRVKGSLRIIGISPGSVARSEGASAGDEIVAVDGQSVLGKDPFDVMALMQEGAPGISTVGKDPPPLALSIVRSEDGKEVSLSLPRKRIDDEPILETRTEKSKDGKSVGYVFLPKFDRAAEREMILAMDKLKAAGADHLVIDLRSNVGGSLDESLAIAKLFLDPGETVLETVLTNRGRQEEAKKLADSPSDSATGEQVRTYKAETPPLYGRSQWPVITVQVDGLTASASEIFAGALQENCRAVVAGQETFGKGLIQTVYGISDGSGLKTTTGKYRLPSGRDLDQTGITPNFRDVPTDAEAQAAIKSCEIARALAAGT